MPCLAGIAILALILGGIFGLGWVVIAPLGAINQVRVKRPRFQLLDLFWLVLLLQLSMIFVGLMVRERQGWHPQWIMIYLLMWVGVGAGWYAMTGALLKAGVTSSAKRAAAVLLILPMIGAVNPFALLLHLGFFAYVSTEHISLLILFGALLGEIAFIAALFGCRKLSRWIASGLAESTKE